MFSLLVSKINSKNYKDFQNEIKMVQRSFENFPPVYRLKGIMMLMKNYIYY